MLWYERAKVSKQKGVISSGVGFTAKSALKIYNDPNWLSVVIDDSKYDVRIMHQYFELAMNNLFFVLFGHPGIYGLR